MKASDVCTIEGCGWAATEDSVMCEKHIWKMKYEVLQDSVGVDHVHEARRNAVANERLEVADRERRVITEANRATLNELHAVRENLKATQARCTELLEECRRLRAGAIENPNLVRRHYEDEK